MINITLSGPIEEADQESIDIAIKYVFDRLDLMPWIQTEMSEITEHNNEIKLEYVVLLKAQQRWMNGGSIIVDWMDPSVIHYQGPFGRKKFHIYDPAVLDQIIDFLRDKFRPRVLI